MQTYRYLARILMLCLIVFFAVSMVSDLLASGGAGSVASALRSVDDDSAAPAAEQHGGDGGSAHGEFPDRTKEMHDPGIIGNLVTLLMLVVLQAVLGFDNLLYISLESKNAPEDKRQMVRSWGIGLAIFLRIALLFALVSAREFFEEFSVFQVSSEYFKANVNLHSLIVLVGGVFIMYTGMKEIWHLTRMDHGDHAHGGEKKKSLAMVIFWILLMNVVFSFDSILSAMALTDVFWVMTAAIIISGVMMIYLSERVSTFLGEEQNVRGAWFVCVADRGHHVGQRRRPLGSPEFLWQRCSANDQNHVLLRVGCARIDRHRSRTLPKEIVGQ